MSLSVDENGGSSSDDGKNCSRGHWRPAEDDKLKQLVEQFGPRNWNSIAEHIEGRTGKSCRLRWFNQLDPRINRKPFSEEEEERLLAAHRRYGNKWSLIARLFPGRTDNAVKNHYHVIIARQHRERPKRNEIGNNNNASSNHNISIFGKVRRPRSERYDTDQLGFLSSVATHQEDDEFSYLPSANNMRRSTVFNFTVPQQPMSRFQPFGDTSSIAWDLDKQIIHSALAINNNHNNSNNNGKHSKGFNIIDHRHQQKQQKQRRVDDNYFGISKLGIGYQSWKNNNVVLEFPFSSISASSSSYGNVKQPTRAVLQHDHQSRVNNKDDESSSSSIQRKDVPFIDFLGVGIAS